MTARSVETVVVGAGQSGLLMSDLLRQAGREHVLLDRRSALGGGWQDRWDAFQLVGPNWTTSMPSHPYDGDDPDGFMTREELIAYFRRYGAAIDAPVELDTEVQRLRAGEGGANRAARFRLTTSRGEVEARDVVVASGPFQVPHIPAVATGVDPSIHQVHAHTYRNPEALEPGGVLVVGTGQSGVQLAEELVEAGRRVTLAVGHCWRGPRRYRTKDIFWWLRMLATRGREIGVALPSVEQLPDPRARFACNPHVSGHGGGHDTNLRKMGAEGVRLVGRLSAAEGTKVRFAPDLAANLTYADTWFDERVKGVCDRYAMADGLDLPDDQVTQFAFDPPIVDELDLRAEGISTVLWTSGYRPSFDWIELPVIDELGLPIQRGGISSVPGLRFLGTPWLVDMTSGNLLGVVRDAEGLAARW
ncbi:MAG TPA: NAD(P)-binding domain-containing protein [Candidatus Limnocylindrales bacterium]|nr:NAD(P)-binding domain-containing protein [Candidatus Limnocylindrales bacterium]